MHDTLKSKNKQISPKRVTLDSPTLCQDERAEGGSSEMSSEHLELVEQSGFPRPLWCL